MKKFLKIIILSYLLITLNTNANSQNLNESTDESNNILKIGVLVPLSGKFKQIGKSVLQAIQLAVVDLNKPNVIIFPKDSKGNSNDTYFAAKEFTSEQFNHLVQLPEILSTDEELEVGEFELGIFRVVINKVKTYEKELVVCEH